MINACIDWCFGDKGLCLSKDALFRDWMVAFYIFPFLSALRNYLPNVLVCVGFFYFFFIVFSFLARPVVECLNPQIRQRKEKSQSESQPASQTGLWRPQHVNNETAAALSSPDTQTELW